MKILTSWVSLAVVVVLLLTCIGILVVEKNQFNEINAAEFEFSLTFGPNGLSSINTFTNTITREGISVADYSLSDKDRNKILSMLKEMEILSFPKDLSVVPYYDHVEYIYLHVFIDGYEHKVRWTVPWDFSFMDEIHISDMHKDFIRFVEYVKKLVWESDEYQALPKSPRGFL